MIDKIDSVALAIYTFLFETTYIAPALLIIAGIFFTIRLGLPQFRLFGESIRVVSEKPKDKNGISSFGALMVSTASRVGTGNIIGVSSAICIGGFGAIFWMWITAILGGATSFVESTLAQIYKKKSKDGTYYGGPSYYMQDALKQRWLGIIFAIALILTYAVGYNMLAVHNTKTAFSGFSFYDEKVTSIIVGAVLTILFAAVVLGGAKRLTKVTGVLVPVMGVLYILVSLVVIVLNAKNIPFVFKSIFVSAFDFKAIFGGFVGSCFLKGLTRGLYSNEAGMGSAPNAAATADVSHPAKQGLVQMLSVFIDTLLICSATALMCMCANPNGLAPEVAGADYVQQSMAMTLGNFGPIFIAIALCLFAFTTLIGNFYYCEGCLKFILKREPSKIGILVFRIVACALVFCGCLITKDLAWDAADALQGIMVLINIPVILILAKPAIKALKDYTKQRKEGKNPEFKAADIGIANTECWK